MKGIRVAMTCGFLASGTSLPIIACVSRLGEQELPGRDSLILKIPGFCIGRGANVSNKEIGHVLFMRGTKGTKQQKFCWYQKYVFIPGVNRNCLEFDYLGILMVSEILAEDTTVVAIQNQKRSSQDSNSSPKTIHVTYLKFLC